MRDTRDLTEGSVEYAIDSTLCANGVDRKVYHGHIYIREAILGSKLFIGGYIFVSSPH
jgi:hypothetical protein